MKRFIAAALSFLLGVFGYTIVDSTIENRVSSLENEVVALRGEISKFHYSSVPANEPEETSIPGPTVAPPDNNDTQVLGYRYDADGNFYYSDDKDCWQKGASYNEVYDNMAPMTAMFIDQVRIKFNYEGKDWMVQFWKGQYGWLLVGAEVGLYTAPEGTATDISDYNCADKEDWLEMSMSVYWAEGNDGEYDRVVFRPYADYWWCTGFVKGQLTKFAPPRTELKTQNRITFKNVEMADAFVAELEKAGFIKTDSFSASQLTNDSYCQNGADVWITWATINHDSFI